MPTPNPEPAVVRLTTPAQMVASLPLYLGYTPTESLVVACLHEPRGRIGLTMRFDLPPQELEPALVEDAVRRVRMQRPSRLLVVVFTHEEGDAEGRPREDLVGALLSQVDDDVSITDAVLVRGDRFWSYLCSDRQCCPPDGTPTEVARADGQVRLLEAEQVVRGRAVLPDRDDLARSLAGPAGPAAEHSRRVLEEVSSRLALDWSQDVDAARDQLLREWRHAVPAFAADPWQVDEEQALRLVASLDDRLLRDTVACSFEPEELLPLLADLCRRTPAPYDAPVATLFAWMTYCEGGGAAVTIALDRAEQSERGYALAGLLRGMLDQQTSPEELRRVMDETAEVLRAARRTAPRSRRSPGSAS